MQCIPDSQVIQGPGSDHLTSQGIKHGKPGKAAGRTQPVSLEDEARLSAAAQEEYFGISRKGEHQWRLLGEKQRER